MPKIAERHDIQKLTESQSFSAAYDALHGLITRATDKSDDKLHTASIEHLGGVGELHEAISKVKGELKALKEFSEGKLYVGTKGQHLEDIAEPRKLTPINALSKTGDTPVFVIEDRDIGNGEKDTFRIKLGTVHSLTPKGITNISEDLTLVSNIIGRKDFSDIGVNVKDIGALAKELQRSLSEQRLGR